MTTALENRQRICYVCDARSPIAQNWIRYFLGKSYDVHVISTYPYTPEVLPGATMYPVVVGRGNISINAGDSIQRRKRLLKQIVTTLSRVSYPLTFYGAEWLSALDVSRQRDAVRHLLNQIQPDLIHAMRIPFEGILTAAALPPRSRFLVSVWGNDFTLHTRMNPLVAQQTRETLRRVQALHTDCWRDLRLAKQWDFDETKPHMVAPGAGGIDVRVFYPAPAKPELRKTLGIPEDAPIVINPRGIRRYVRNDIFFQAIPLVLKQHPETIFVCTGMKDNPVVEQWVNESGVQANVRLLGTVPHRDMADLFRLAKVTVSPSLHDGTPNTLLEAMSCGVFPVAGDQVESVQEWIRHEDNGLLFDVADAQSEASAVLRALDDETLHASALQKNQALIRERADYDTVMAQAESFYHQLIAQRAS